MQKIEYPTVRVGDIVLWFAGTRPHVKPQPAMVMEVVMNGQLHLNVFRANAMSFREAVPHKTDPTLGRVMEVELQHTGCWMTQDEVYPTVEHEGDEEHCEAPVRKAKRGKKAAEEEVPEELKAFV